MKRNLFLILALTIFTLNISIIIDAHCGDTWTGKDGVLPLPVEFNTKDCAHPVNGVDTAGQIYKKLTYAHIYWLDVGHRQDVLVIDTGQGGLPNGDKALLL